MSQTSEIKPAETWRGYGLNLALACVAAGAGVTAWRIADSPDTAYPTLWLVGSFLGECVALIGMREATKHWRALRALKDDARAAQPLAPRAVASAPSFAQSLRAAGKAAVDLGRMIFAPFAYVRNRVDRLGGWATFVYLGGGGWLVSEGMDLPEGDATGLLFAPSLVMIVYGLLFLREGLPRLYAALFAPASPSVLHGSARTASADEARHAARGNAGGAWFHQEQFKD